MYEKAPPAAAIEGAAAADEGEALVAGGWTEDAATGVRRRTLANGLAVNYKHSPHETQRGAVRLAVVGGRALEPADKPGAVLLGSRTIQEGGAFPPWKREQVGATRRVERRERERERETSSSALFVLFFCSSFAFLARLRE